jgi:hypothetical protein
VKSAAQISRELSSVRHKIGSTPFQYNEGDWQAIRKAIGAGLSDERERRNTLEQICNSYQRNLLADYEMLDHFRGVERRQFDELIDALKLVQHALSEEPFAQYFRLYMNDSLRLETSRTLGYYQATIEACLSLDERSRQLGGRLGNIRTKTLDDSLWRPLLDFWVDSLKRPPKDSSALFQFMNAAARPVAGAAVATMDSARRFYRAQVKQEI